MKIRGRIMPALLATGLIAAPLVGVAPAFAADGPTIAVTPDADLDPQGENSLTITGSGFTPVDPEAGIYGVYVAIGPEGLFDRDDFHSNSALFTGAVSVAGIPENGEFSTQVTLESPTIDSAGTSVDCTATECGVYTWAARGSDDRSQDTYHPIAFAKSDDGNEDDEDETNNDPVWEPQFELFNENGDLIGNSEVTEGDVITVRGTGFDPFANESARPPITQGNPPGYYVIFGKFAQGWRPSEGYGSSERKIGEQRWILPKSTLDEEPAKGAIVPQWVELDADDGSFEVNLTAEDIEDGPENGVYGVYIFPASGAVNADHELMQELNYVPLADDDEPQWEPSFELFDENGDPLGNSKVVEGDVITVRGTGFDPQANIGGYGNPIPSDLPQGNYVVFGKFAPAWKPSEGIAAAERKSGDTGWILPESVVDQIPDPDHEQSVRAGWVPLGDDGAFEAQLTASDLEDGPADGIYGIYVYPASGIKNADYELMQSVNYNSASTGGGEQDPEDSDEDDKCLAADSGSLTWNIHTSFLSYIENLSDGKVALSGVRDTSSGFKFDLTSGNYDSDSKLGIIKFTGSVHFTGHNGALDVKLANPQLHINKNEATLLVDVTTDGKLEKNVTFGVVDAKNAQTSASSYALDSAGAVLTSAGATVMQGFYEAGTDIAPVTTQFQLGGEGECGDDLVSEKKPPAPKPTPPQNPGDSGPIDLTSQQQTGEAEVAMCRSTQGASLNWGIKQSFTDYVTGPIADGSVARANGVSGSFNWPGRTANFDPESGLGEFSFGGTVTYSGHDGALNMRISNPRVKITSASQGQLFADVRATNPAGKVTVDASGVHIANLNVSGKKSVSGDTITFSSVPATLTASGVPAFAEFYEAGSALDSLSLTVTLGPEVPCDTLSSGTTVLPRTGSDFDLAGAGAVFLLLGLATVATRRRMRTIA